MAGVHRPITPRFPQRGQVDLALRRMLGLLAVGLVMPPAAQGQSVDVFEECPADVRDCIVMTLDAPDLQSILVEEVPTGRVQVSQFTVAVEGALQGGPSGSILLDVEAFVNGMECSAFGQAEVAVLGFAADERPIIATSMGPLTLTSDALRVGCPDCASLMDAEGARSPAATVPGWDLTLVGIREWDLPFDPAGSLFVSQSDRCLRIPLLGPIEATDVSTCAPASLVGTWMDPPEGVALEPFERLLSVQGTEVMLVLDVGACT